MQLDPGGVCVPGRGTGCWDRELSRSSPWTQAPGLGVGAESSPVSPRTGPARHSGLLLWEGTPEPLCTQGPRDLAVSPPPPKYSIWLMSLVVYTTSIISGRLVGFKGQKD